MNRCLLLPIAPLLRILCLSLAATALYASPPAAAQTMWRQLPANTQRGTLVVTAPPEVLLDGVAERLAPGARIRDANQMMVMSAALVGSSVPVRYVRDALGLIREVWILSAEEVQALGDAPDGATKVTYGSAALPQPAD